MDRRFRFAVITLLTATVACGGGAESSAGSDVAIVSTDADAGLMADPDTDAVDAPTEADSGSDAESEAAEEPPEPAPHSMHHRVDLHPGTYLGASVEVKIDEVPRHGLRFFALQVNFDDVAWAHGGLQRDPDDGRANWGGLVSGIDYDFEGAEQEVLANIQNTPGRSREATWSQGTWYRYEVSRGELETLPPGEYSVLSEEPVTVAEAREMWRWNFTITDIASDEMVWEHHLYVAHPEITRMTYWTETGYGITCDDVLTVQWRNPRIHLDDGRRVLPKSLGKSMSQSTCPPDSTTDMAKADNDGEWGTTQWYGVERARGSRHGEQMYSNPFRP